MLVSTLALVAPVHAAQCTQDQALAFTTVLMEVASSPDCASITITDPAISDLCKAPKCAAAFRAKLDRFPDCVAQGENIRAQVKKMTNCGGSSAASSLGATTRDCGHQRSAEHHDRSCPGLRDDGIAIGVQV
ncbi:hypothetical protein PINS_up019319 [Pythium insidiosum]|nr:hypothetical protein PINS_up019319 [Pythium insidiosum]